MIFLILIIFFVLILILCFTFAYFKHKKIYGSRFEKNEYVKYYTKEEFDLNSKNYTIRYKNEKIEAFLYYKDNYIEDKIIVLTHGMYATHEAYMQDIAYLVNNNFLVFSYDVLGVGKSSGKNICGVGNSTKSLNIVLNYINKEFSDKKIYLYGHSWGAFASLNILKYHKGVDKVVSISPFINSYIELKNFTKTNLLTPFVYLIDFFECGKFSHGNLSKSLKKYKGKALIIASQDDKVINFNKNTRVLKTKYPNFSYLIENCKNHNPNYTKEAVNLLNDFSLKLSELKGEELIDFMKNTNYHALGELDKLVMDKIVLFLKES